ncbi:hypothetical protein LX32DRAFT_377938 [Colletotrichum zoysiae]|uniref:Uncharacterized protein n=1 Tax=Colletotrichum zoysiae TaxID=1216348 RepID=A0AAD9HJA2_9PEZI|nr:hypothetical protein LX32DRAFT_377938 [Colletotrichum zoysiae]
MVRIPTCGYLPRYVRKQPPYREGKAGPSSSSLERQAEPPCISTAHPVSDQRACVCVDYAPTVAQSPYIVPTSSPDCPPPWRHQTLLEPDRNDGIHSASWLSRLAIAAARQCGKLAKLLCGTGR